MYHIITSIAVASDSPGKSDLYILDQFYGTRECASRIEEKGIFDQVKCIDPKKLLSWGCKLQKWTRLLLDYIFCDKIASSILIEDTEYSNFCFHNTYSVEALILRFYFMKHDMQVQFVLIEDGVLSYAEMHKKRRILLDRIMRSILCRGKESIDTIRAQMLYSPELYQKLNGSSPIPVRQIPRVFSDPKYVALYNDIFQFDESCKISERVIMLLQIKGEICAGKEQERLLDIYRLVAKECGEGNVIAKKHPRDKDPKMEGVKYYDKAVPFECVYMNMDCSSKIFVSVMSTGVANAKLLFDQEAHVILLYKLLKLNLTDAAYANIDRYFNACKSLYKDPDRFMIPETIEELTAGLRKALSE